jgi:hypothetical protein
VSVSTTVAGSRHGASLSLVVLSHGELPRPWLKVGFDISLAGGHSRILARLLRRATC